MVEDLKGHYLSMISYLGKTLKLEIKGIKCQKRSFFAILSDIPYQKFLIFCMVVDGNKVGRLNMILYVVEILI